MAICWPIARWRSACFLAYSSWRSTGAAGLPHIQVGYQPTAAPSPSRADSTGAARPTATATSEIDERVRVVNTDGQGVVLRASPRDDDKTPRGFMDGTWVTMLEQHGADWARVR